MPQQPSDWVTVGSDSGDDWQTINSPAPTQAEPQESSILEDWNNLWMNQPLSRKLTVNDTQVFDPQAAANYYDDPAARTEDQWKIPSWVPFAGGGTLRSLGAGMLEGAGNVIEGFTTPLNLATMGTAKGAQSLGQSAAALREANKAAEAAKRLQQARAATTATRALSAPVMATGAARIGEGIGEGDWANVGMGLTELAGGAAGVKMPYPTGKPMPVRQPAAPIEATPDAMPVRLPHEFQPDRPIIQEDIFGGTSPIKEPIQQAPPTTATPEIRQGLLERGFRDYEINNMPMQEALQHLETPAPPPIEPVSRVKPPRDGEFDPNTLAGLERATPDEVQFVDPNTGEVVPASQAKPGDVPLIPETPPAPPKRAGSRMGAPELGLPKSNTFMDWLNNLAKEEGGEFDIDAIPNAIRRFTGEETPSPARRDISENVSRENRNFVDNLPDEALRDYIARFTDNPNYAPNTVGGDILEYGRGVLERRIRLADDVENLGLDRLTPEQASNAIEYYENRGRTDIVDYLSERYQRARTQPRAYDLGEISREPIRTGWESIDTSTLDQPPELPVRPGRSLEEIEAAKKTPALGRLGKMIGEDRAQQLATGERQIEFSETARRAGGKRLPRDTTKSWGEWGDAQIKDVIPDPAKVGIAVEPHNISNLFPKAFSIAYRDASGNPIGVLHTDLQGTGISTLAVDSKIGLRRGKVAFEMLKEAFDRGISEPSGPVSDMTRNLIERVKRLAKSESGEFDADVVIDAINKMISSISSSKIGKAVGRFFRDESGHVDMDRLRALFKKQEEGTITPDELAEAKSMAQEYQAAQSAASQVTQDLSQRLGSATEGGGTSAKPPRTPRGTRTQYGPTRQPVQGPEYLGSMRGGTTHPRNLPMDTSGPAVAPRRPAGTPRMLGPTRPPREGPRKPAPKGTGQLLHKDQLQPGVPIRYRKPPKPGFEQSMLGQIWNVPRSLQSIDLPGITSAALRQSRPLSFTADWFRAWNSAFKSFGSKGALDAINAKISDSKYFKPRYEPVKDVAGNIRRYTEKPSVAEELGVKMTDVIRHREEAIASALAEKIPGYGRYVKASNRAYTGFLNDLRAAKFEQLMDAAKALGRDPEVDIVLGKKLADFVNNATGRGSLEYIGGKINLEPIGDVLGAGLYSPRALSARLAFMNPHNYTMADPMIRTEYWKGLARIGAGWGAASGLASLMPGVHVSMDPNNADFGKIRIGNTRFDPGAGFQQLLVLSNRMLPRVLGGGGTASSTGPAGRPGKFTPLGSSPMAPTRLSLPARYLYNQLNPSLRFVFDMLSATSKEPFDLTDRTLQAVLPMYVSDIAEAAKSDAGVAEFFAPLLSSMGTGVQSYERGSFNKPQITPFIEQVTGAELPTMQIGR